LVVAGVSFFVFVRISAIVLFPVVSARCSLVLTHCVGPLSIAFDDIVALIVALGHFAPFKRVVGALISFRTGGHAIIIVVFFLQFLTVTVLLVAIFVDEVNPALFEIFASVLSDPVFTLTETVFRWAFERTMILSPAFTIVVPVIIAGHVIVIGGHVIVILGHVIVIGGIVSLVILGHVIVIGVPVLITIRVNAEHFFNLFTTTFVSVVANLNINVTSFRAPAIIDFPVFTEHNIFAPILACLFSAVERTFSVLFAFLIIVGRVIFYSFELFCNLFTFTFVSLAHEAD